jgi:hypothetical protein
LDVQLSIISFSEIEEVYPIMYKQLVGFTVHLPDRDILFKKKGKIHLADFAEIVSNVLAMQAYTKVEQEHACRVHDLICTSG